MPLMSGSASFIARSSTERPPARSHQFWPDRTSGWWIIPTFSPFCHVDPSALGGKARTRRPKPHRAICTHECRRIPPRRRCYLAPVLDRATGPKLTCGCRRINDHEHRPGIERCSRRQHWMLRGCRNPTARCDGLGNDVAQLAGADNGAAAARLPSEIARPVAGT